jgi:hypothetical protein
VRARAPLAPVHQRGGSCADALEKLYRDLKVTKLNTLEELLDFTIRVGKRIGMR